MARRIGTALAVMALGVSVAAHAATESDDAARAREDRIQDLERKVDVLTDELSRLRVQQAVPEDDSLVSEYGMGPAASKVYGLDRGLSIGGYGEGFYRAFTQDKGDNHNETDMLRLVLYTGYKFTDWIVFNSEIEFEHASTEENGSVSVELATLDFLWKPELNFRVGLMLAPVGFLNEVHEPPFFYGVMRPETELAILPTTWRANGAGIFGTLGETVEYRAYALTSLDATGFDDEGIREGRQNGSESLAEDIGFAGRLDWRPDTVPGLLLGASTFVGNTGQDQNGPNGSLPDALLTVADVHAQYRRGDFQGRVLVAYNHVNDANHLNDALGSPFHAPVASDMLGGYAEVAYDVWPWLTGESTKSLRPFFRVEYVDTQFDVPNAYSANRNQANWIFNPGIQFYPHPNVVLKLAYRAFEPAAGDHADEFNVGFGFAF